MALLPSYSVSPSGACWRRGWSRLAFGSAGVERRSAKREKGRMREETDGERVVKVLVMWSTYLGWW